MFLSLMGFAFLGEYVNAGIGMMYGTFLSPLLISLGYEPAVVIPSVLLSQGVSAIAASFFHHKFKNAKLFYKINWKKIFNFHLAAFHLKNDEKIHDDFLVSLLISVAGMFSTVVAVFLSTFVSKEFVSIYVAALVVTMGLMLLFKVTLKFSLKKMVALGIFGSFNKGFTGGGLGPILSSGQVATGRKSKNSIAVTMFSEIFICIAGFFMYWLVNGFSNWGFVIALSTGALLATPFGAMSTKKMNQNDIKPVIGSLAVFLGIWMFIRMLSVKL